MNPAVRCQVAELVSTSLREAGIHPHTGPWIAVSRLFAPMLEQRLPMERAGSIGAQQRRGTAFALIAIVAFMPFLLLLPLDLWRVLRARRHHRAAMARLAGDELGAAVRAAAGLVCIDFRIEQDGRAMLRGSALASVDGGEPSVLWLDGHLGAPPPDVPDAAALARRIAPLADPPEVAHWVWQRTDAYELEVRESCAW